MVEQPKARALPTQDNITHKNTGIYTSSPTRTHDPCIRVVETHSLDRVIGLYCSFGDEACLLRDTTYLLRVHFMEVLEITHRKQMKHSDRDSIGELPYKKHDC